MSAEDTPDEGPFPDTAARAAGSTRSNLSGSAGDVVQARDVHGGVHFHGSVPAARPSPRQLPADVRGFVNRSAELDLLNSILNPEESGPPQAGVFVIVGTAGVGKSSLAIHWAHRVHQRFPDGQLCVNLRGYDPGAPIAPEAVLGRFLRALDVPPRAIPADLEAMAALYRTLLADRRALILLDNAATVGQVRPLLPGTPGCLVIVTSRNRLSGLAVRDGARRLTLKLLPEPDAVDLLHTLTAEYRANEDPGKLAELAHLCARLPLALRIAAERAASRPWMPLDDLIRDLRDESALWEALSTDAEDESDAVRTVFAWSYRALTEPAARLFRLLGLHPGPEFGTQAAAAMAGLPVPDTRHLLDVLVGAHLVEQGAPDRYQFHDLLRAYAIDQVSHHETDASRQAVVRRTLSWYLQAANAAETRIGALDLRITIRPPDTGISVPAFPDQRDAAVWLELERANLLAAIRVASSDPGLRHFAWQIPAILRSYYMRHNLFDDWFAGASLGLEAARALADRRGQAELLDSLGMAHVAAQQLDAGAECHLATLSLRRELGDRRGEAVSLNALGLTYLRGRKLTDARPRFLESLAAFEELDDVIWSAVALANLGETQSELSEYAQAAESVGRALTIFRDARDAQGEGNALRILSMVYREQGQFAEALPAARQAVGIAVDNDNRMWEGYWLIELGAVQLAVGDHHGALVSYQRAASVQRRLGDRIREAMALDGAGQAYQAMARFDEAIDFHRGAVRTFRDLADSWQLASALNYLASALSAAGIPGEARDHWREAASMLAAFSDKKTIWLGERIAEELNR